MSEIDLLKLKSILEEYASETGSKKQLIQYPIGKPQKNNLKIHSLSLITVGEGITKTVPKKN